MTLTTHVGHCSAASSSGILPLITANNEFGQSPIFGRLVGTPRYQAWLFPHPAFRQQSSNHFIGRRVFARHRQKLERLIQRSDRLSA
jgi:hypothetical protein